VLMQSVEALRGPRDGGGGGRKPGCCPGTDRGRGGSDGQVGCDVEKGVGEEPIEVWSGVLAKAE